MREQHRMAVSPPVQGENKSERILKKKGIFSLERETGVRMLEREDSLVFVDDSLLVCENRRNAGTVGYQRICRCGNIFKALSF